MSSVTTFTDASLAATLAHTTGVVIVDVWAAWCAPCRAIAPTIESLAQTYQGRAVVGKLDFDANPVTAEQYGVRSIPTILFFQDGVEVDRVVGAHPLPVFVERLDRVLISAAATV
jgi:thioredoxin 1